MEIKELIKKFNEAVRSELYPTEYTVLYNSYDEALEHLNDVFRKNLLNLVGEGHMIKLPNKRDHREDYIPESNQWKDENWIETTVWIDMKKKFTMDSCIASYEKWNRGKYSILFASAYEIKL
jgi:hypothetical protein